MPLTIWSGNDLLENLDLGMPVVREGLESVDVAFGQPDPAAVLAADRLRWVHITSAGYTRFDQPEFWEALRAKGIAFTNSSSVFDDPCAQHTLAFMLAHCRALPAAAEVQRERRWDHSEFRSSMQVLRDQTVLILGYGAIARRLVEMLAPFKLTVIGFRRSPKGDEGIPVYPISELEKWLPKADFIVNVLPANTGSDRILDDRVFAQAKRGVVLTNVGRGATVDSDALLRALESGQVGAAYLDVTDPEPLPAEHPLWNAPNCTITPHIAGGFQGEDAALVRHFQENLRRFENGEALLDRVV